MEKSAKLKRTSVYDWLRILATFLVVVGHSSYLEISTNLGGVSYILPDELHPAYEAALPTFFRMLGGFAYCFHMPLFFMLSGAVLRLKPIKRLDEFVGGKLKRLFIPYFAAGYLFMIPVKYFGNFYAKENLKGVFGEFLHGNESGHLWFLPALFWCMLVFVIIEKLLAKLKINSVYALLFISIVIQMSLDRITFDFFLFKTGLEYIAYFAMGYAMEDIRKRVDNKENMDVKQKIASMLFDLAVGCVCYQTVFKGWQEMFLNSTCQIVLGIVGTFFLADFFSISCKRFENSMVYKVVNRNLFNIYLFHDPLQYIVLKMYMNGTALTTRMGNYTYSFMRTFGVILISIVIGELWRLVLVMCKSLKKK